MKERMLTILVPIKDSDAVEVTSLPAVSPDNINVIYKYNGVYKRVWLNPETNQYEYKTVVDREFPYIGHPLEIFDFTYDAVRMGTAPVITAQNVKWYADKDENGEDITLEDKWIEYGQECHVVFNGINYYLKQIPTSTKNNEDARYNYSVDFISETSVLETVYIYDIVQPFYTERPVSQSSVFSFFGDISALVKRVNASLLASGLANLVRKHVYYPDPGSRVEVPYLTYEQWNLLRVNPSALIGSVFETLLDMDKFYNVVYMPLSGNYQLYLYTYIYESEDGEYVTEGYKCILGKDKYGAITTSEEKLVSFDKNYIQEALQQVKDTFDLQYYITRERDNEGFPTGNILIVIGDCEYDFADMNAAGTDYKRDADGVPTTDNPFNYGVDFEDEGYKAALLSKEKTNTTEKIITRITGVGSSENIPWYYPNPTADGWIKPLFKIDGIESSIIVDYPQDEDSVEYEKFLKNRIGDVFQYGRVEIYKSSYGYANVLSIIQSAYSIQLAYVFNIDFDNAVYTNSIRCLVCDNMAAILKKDGQTYTPDFSLIDGHGVLPQGHYILYLGWIDTNPVFTPQVTLYYYYEAQTWHETGFSTIAGLKYYMSSPGVGWWYQNDDITDVVDLLIPELNTKYYSYHDNDPSNNLADEHYWTYRGYTQGAGHVVRYGVPADIQDIVSNYIRGSVNIILADGWYRNTGSKKVDLADYGLSVSSSARSFDITDTIEFKRLKYLTPCGNLMPEVYIKTDGERRYYDAVNYPRTGTPDPMIGETTDSGGSVVNPIYQKEDDGVHYDFENEISSSLPKEHIEDFEDVKPSIKGMYNYYTVFFSDEPDDWSEIYTEYYIKTLNGEFIPATSTWNEGTVYYRKVRIDVVEEFAYDELDNDEVWENNDNGNVSGEYKHPFFFAKLRPLGFNLFDLALQDDMVLSVTTGNCGACNFKIGVDENTGKNPVQLWEYNVYGGYDYEHRGQKLYSAGDLKRYVDVSQLYYDTDGTPSGYKPVSYYTNMYQEGFLVHDNNVTRFLRPVYDADEVINGEVGSMKQDSKTHFEGDVVVSGRFIESQQNTAENFVWVALYKDTDTYGTIMPSAKPDYDDGNFDYYIRPKSVQDVHTSESTLQEDEEKADKFVLVNIRMPQKYLRHAERELAKKLVEFMDGKNYQKFNFSINHSRVFLAEREEVDNNLNENSVVYVDFNRKVYRQYVQHYTYRMSHDAVLPEITISMNEELSVSRTKTQRDKIETNRISREVSRSLSAGLNTMRESIMRKAVSRNDDILLNGNIVSRDGRTSVLNLREGLVTQSQRTEKLETSRQSTREFIDEANEFNSAVSTQLKRIRLTVEGRMQSYIGATQDSSCPTYRYNYNSQRDTAELLWLNNDGTAKMYNPSLECPTNENMSDITWSEFIFS